MVSFAMLDPIRILSMIVLIFAFYAFVKINKYYQRKRELPGLVFTALFLLLGSYLWVQFYGGRLQALFFSFDIVFAFIPLVAFIVMDNLEGLRLKEEAEKVRIRAFFGRYVSPKIIDELLKEKDLSMKGQSKYVTVMFTDVRGFTKLSERYNPEQIIDILNEYFNVATNAIHKYDGTIDKFIGDAMMVFWNAPADVKDHEWKAVQAAIEIQKELDILNAAREKVGQLPIHIGMGIHAGEAIIGNIGSQTKVDFTAIGDTVNTASRLEGATLVGEIAISENVRDKIKGKVQVREPEFYDLKGKSEPFKVYKVIWKPGMEKASGEKRSLMGKTHKAGESQGELEDKRKGGLTLSNGKEHKKDTESHSKEKVDLSKAAHLMPSIKKNIQEGFEDTEIEKAKFPADHKHDTSSGGKGGGFITSVTRKVISERPRAPNPSPPPSGKHSGKGFIGRIAAEIKDAHEEKKTPAKQESRKKDKKHKKRK